MTAIPSHLRAQVAIIGAGPAGLLLSHLLSAEGVDSVLIETRSQDHVQSRIRAGISNSRPALHAVEGSRNEFSGIDWFGRELRRTTDRILTEQCLPHEDKELR
jgi:2-polyprenyl-6-methoxyphenol hydroxylase-like FAD-dependent oxidoreductase